MTHITGQWIKLHKQDLHTLQASPDIIRMNKSRRTKWVGHVACFGATRNTHKISDGKPAWNRPLGKPGHKWEDNIKIQQRETGLKDVNCAQLAQNMDWWWAVVNMVMNLHIP
jgi:hypothetical protein